MGEGRERAAARQWSRVALAFAALFASLPFTTWLLTGSWRSPGAFELAILCLLGAAYLHMISRRSRPASPDTAAMLADAIQLAAEGTADQAIQLLTRTIELSPWCWQAFEYRGMLRRLADPAGALGDLNEAIRLAPGEGHLYAIRAELHRALGEGAAASRDEETAAALGN